MKRYTLWAIVAVTAALTLTADYQVMARGGLGGGGSGIASQLPANRPSLDRPGIGGGGISDRPGISGGGINDRPGIGGGGINDRPSFGNIRPGQGGSGIERPIAGGGNNRPNF